MRRTQQLLTAAILAAGLAACASTPPPSITGATPVATSTASNTRHVDVPGFFSADQPSWWMQASFDTMAISHAFVPVYFSTEAISNPCSRIPATVNCPEYPVDRLEGNGVLVTWTQRGLGGEQVDWTQGASTTIGGLAARLVVGPGDAACTAIGGEREMVGLLRGAQTNWTEMRACYLGPDLEKTEAELHAMLASIQWH